MAINTDFKSLLAELNNQYRHTLPEKLATLEHAIVLFKNNGGEDLQILQSLIHQAHKLAGSAGSFGLSSLSSQAKKLEIYLQNLQLPASLPSIQYIEKLFSEFDTSLDLISESETTAIPVPKSQLVTNPTIETQGLTENNNSPLKHVLLMDDDEELLEHFKSQLLYFGYITHCFSTIEQIPKPVSFTPDVIIMDICLLNNPLGGIALLNQLLDENPAWKQIPILFISSRSDQEARLHAARSKAQGYFVKPVDINDLIDQLDVLSQKQKEDSLRVLIMEDSSSLAHFYAAHLQHAGMVTQVVTDPLKFLESLIEFGPELILMDMYMPTWNGYELAKMLNQQEAYISTPIIFLSSEQDLAKQMLALEAGGDDFLTKPIEMPYLIASIQHRAGRYRQLRQLMNQDRLTGLLNHTKTKEILEIELIRAKRQITPLSFIMLDVDHFKRVNDNFGHPMGDRILKTLASLLKQRLRKTDVIGRYGGEEFAIILPGVEAEQAVLVIDLIREAFALIQHRSKETSFCCTFSAGISSYPIFTLASDLISAADMALYEAKKKWQE